MGLADKDVDSKFIDVNADIDFGVAVADSWKTVFDIFMHKYDMIAQSQFGNSLKIYRM